MVAMVMMCIGYVPVNDLSFDFSLQSLRVPTHENLVNEVSLHHLFRYYINIITTAIFLTNFSCATTLCRTSANIFPLTTSLSDNKSNKSEYDSFFNQRIRLLRNQRRVLFVRQVVHQCYCMSDTHECAISRVLWFYLVGCAANIDRSHHHTPVLMIYMY
jgi:hypothetical protein